MNLRKAIAVVSCLLLLGCLLFFAFQWDVSSSESTPPVLQVQAGEEIITANQGGYCWNERGKAVCVDATDPAEDLEERQGVSAVSGGNVELVFDNPPYAIEVEGKSIGGRWEKQQINNLQMELPETKDNYIYRVSGQWEQGDVSYAFLVRAK
ncbi:hypothetical protein [Terribacillus saccharophilus]|uniref:Uncharacterized protein n=1 Tax=Terribacillus saccharophilus TaxID=361277 RepID=A0ABX4GVX5_9BACI|nr:hypothetical protein [Terribacillus saccharophilus]PAD34663.1 hypothetical protein CHH56_12790 [Terribacillus saccharophilus]PAD95411.1 hypothetical protein CHH50_13025 [Terribacillus saccharophilus]PAD98989.1 hypothetical protein CHH48_13920 [Terribacillus saccharophilus]